MKYISIFILFISWLVVHCSQSYADVFDMSKSKDISINTLNIRVMHKCIGNVVWKQQEIISVIPVKNISPKPIWILASRNDLHTDTNSENIVFDLTFKIHNECNILWESPPVPNAVMVQIMPNEQVNLEILSLFDKQSCFAGFLSKLYNYLFGTGRVESKKNEGTMTIITAYFDSDITSDVKLHGQQKMAPSVYEINLWWLCSQKFKTITIQYPANNIVKTGDRSHSSF